MATVVRMVVTGPFRADRAVKCRNGRTIRPSCKLGTGQDDGAAEVDHGREIGFDLPLADRAAPRR